MGLVRQASRAADRVANAKPKHKYSGKRAGRHKYVSGQQTHTKETEQLLKQFPVLMQERLIGPAVRAASKAVRQETKKELNKAGVKAPGVTFAQRVGRSKKTRTQDGWSAKTRYKRNRRSRTNTREDQKPEMYFVIRTRMWRKRKTVAGASTGPLHKYAAQGHLLEFGGYRTVLWGKATMVETVPPRPFLRPSAKRSLPQQEENIKKLMRKWADRI